MTDQGGAEGGGLTSRVLPSPRRSSSMRECLTSKPTTGYQNDIDTFNW